jgi:hypothetical protein
MKKKTSLEEAMERIDKMSDEEKAALYEDFKEATKSMDELEHLIRDAVASWGRKHQDEEHVTAKMMTGLSKGLCHILVVLDETCGDSEHKPSSAFLATLPIGMVLAKKEYDLREHLEHARKMREGVN